MDKIGSDILAANTTRAAIDPTGSWRRKKLSGIWRGAYAIGFGRPTVECKPDLERVLPSKSTRVTKPTSLFVSTTRQIQRNEDL